MAGLNWKNRLSNPPPPTTKHELPDTSKVDTALKAAFTSDWMERAIDWDENVDVPMVSLPVQEST